MKILIKIIFNENNLIIIWIKMSRKIIFVYKNMIYNPINYKINTLTLCVQLLIKVES